MLVLPFKLCLRTTTGYRIIYAESMEAKIHRDCSRQDKDVGLPAVFKSVYNKKISVRSNTSLKKYLLGHAE